jgi:nicotinamidase/pyrazinamidase
MKALLIMDLQNDFLPGGVLPSPKGNTIIPVVNRLMNHFHIIIASKDWHPEQSTHFNTWPVHCVRNTRGASFPSPLRSGKIRKVFFKGTGSANNGYSAFEATNSNLDYYLKKRGVTHLYLAGLTAEYSVKYTTLDALKHNYKAFVIADATAGVDAQPGDEYLSYLKMRMSGAKIINSGATILENI